MISVFSVKNRSILREMVYTDFKIRYQGSILGYFWSLLKPLFLFAILYGIFTYVLKVKEPYYGVTLLAGVVMWNFFSEATMVGASSIVANGDLLRKVSIPRYLIVLSSSFSALINLLLSFIVVIIFALFSGLTPTIYWLALPMLMFELFIFSLGLAFVLATAYVKFRDVTYIWEIFLQAGFYASGIIFPLSMVPRDFVHLFLMNPITQIIQDVRFIITGGQVNIITTWNHTHVPYSLIPIGIILCVIIGGVLYFNNKSKFFAEEV